MKGSLVARRYAKSLLTMAQEGGVVDAVYTDMILVRNTVSDSRELRNLLTSPIVKAEKKKAILSELFKGKVSELSLNFIELVTGKGREALLSVIAQAYEAAFKELKNISTVEVTSAIALSEDQKKKIMALAAKQGVENAEVVERVDPSLIGGFVMRMGDRQIDASISNKINTLKQELIKN